MTAPDVFRLLLQPLHETGIEYMITGSVAATAYGEPRMTNDVDLIVRLDLPGAALLHRAFPEHSYYVPPLETMEEERQRARFRHFNVIHHETALRADVYLAGDDPLRAWAFERRRAETVAGQVVWFAPIEYVIVWKLEYYELSGSDRHLRDIGGMVRISGGDIDMATLGRLLAERGLERLWERAQAS